MNSSWKQQTEPAKLTGKEKSQLIEMKKIGKSLSTLFSVVVMLTSCSSVESDAKKVAELQCKAQKMALKVSAGEMSAIEESTKLTAEAVALAEEMKDKYTTDVDKKEFTEALLKELRNCK